VELTVNLGNYESLRVGLAESFDVGSVQKKKAASKSAPVVQMSK
jgi:hypothetical protein